MLTLQCFNLLLHAYSVPWFSAKLSQAELVGPPDLGSWQSCFDAWARMPMLGAMDLGLLQN